MKNSEIFDNYLKGLELIKENFNVGDFNVRDRFQFIGPFNYSVLSKLKALGWEADLGGTSFSAGKDPCEC